MRVTAKTLNNLQVQLTAGDHKLVADEPVSAGGDGQGPDPYALLLSSLAACKVITVHMYAKRKEWSLDKVIVHLDISKIHARDCEDCESDPDAKVDIIETEIQFEGDLDDEQMERLVQISERCPVHRSLTSEIKIRTRLVSSKD
jgi:putative redox protein